MKLFIVLTTFALAHAAKLNRIYLPPIAQDSAGSSFLETPRQSNGFQDQTSVNSNNGFSSQNGFAQDGAYSGFEARPERAQATFERNAAILRQDNSNDGETYAYAYETENGIYGEENGVATNGVQAQGGYSYTGDDGKVYSVRYTADENGFQPQGDHLPTPPPIPTEILKALEQNARDEAAGIFDDGSYNEAKYDSSVQEQYYTTVQSYNADSFDNNNVFSNNAFSRNDATERDSAISGVQKVYLPPVAHHNNQVSEVSQTTFSNNAFVGNDAAERASTISGVQREYLPPFAQRNNQIGDVVQNNFNDDALIRNDVAGSGSSIAGVQNTYLPPYVPRDNQVGKVTQAIFNNYAFGGNDAVGSVNSIAGVQNTYLPAFPPGNTQRDRISQQPFKRNSITEIQKAYLPPFAPRNNQESHHTFNNNAHAHFDAAERSSAVAEIQKEYLSPVVQQSETSGDAMDAYVPPVTQGHNEHAARTTVDEEPGVDKGYLYATPTFAFTFDALKNFKKKYSKKLMQ